MGTREFRPERSDSTFWRQEMEKRLMWRIVAYGRLKQWGLVIAGISDFSRPAENLSLTQNFALTATGAIWTRWCLIIKPRNILYVPSFRNNASVSPLSLPVLFNLRSENFCILLSAPLPIYKKLTQTLPSRE